MNERVWELWVGAYTDESRTGITRLEMDRKTGELAVTATYAGIENPSFLALNRSGTVLYAVSETMEVEDQPGGRMIAYPIDPDSRKLGPGWERLTYGAAPCHVSLDPHERWLAVANYAGASVTLYPLEPSGKPGDAMVRLRHAGSGPNRERQEAPHPHSAYFDPAGGRQLYVPDLGLDRVMIYENGEDGTDWTTAGAALLEPGDGPRHLAIHPDGSSLYVVSELSSSITRYVREAPGKLVRQETVSTLPAAYQGVSTCAEIAAAPNGRFVYASNRGHDSVAVFSIDKHSGQLTAAGHVSTRGRTPRHFALTPDGQWLIAANQDSDIVVVFRIDSASGLPIYHGNEISISKPVCIRLF